MAKLDITSVNTSDTFQLWLNKTNELVELMNSEVLTASPVGDITIGNATLTGAFTATDLISTAIVTGSLSAASITNNLDPVNFVAFNSPVSVTSTQEKLLVLKSSSQKPAINLINAANANWNVTLGTITATSPFIIETEGTLNSQFTLNQAGDLILSGKLTATSITAALTGNASTATKFAASVNINGVAFDGSAAISINTINTLSRAVTNSYLLGDAFNGSVARAWSVDAASTNTPSKVVVRDAVGDFSAGTITATLVGNATSLTGLTSSVTELNYVDGVTAGIQGQFDALDLAKAPKGSPDFTGTPTAPTAPATTNNTQIATTAFVRSAVSSGVGSIVIPAPVVFPAGSTSGNGISIATTGSVAMSGSYTGTFAVTGSITASGNITATGNVTAYSDERLKSNIRTIDNALDKVSNMRGVYFDKDGAASTGVIAQEVEKVLPEVVFDGEYKSVAYGNIVGILIEAIKELKNEIEMLKKNT